MIFPKYFKMHISAIVSVFCLGMYLGEPGYSIPGISPYFMAAEKLEERVFQPNPKNLEAIKFQDKGEAINQVAKVLSNYKTGLVPESKEKLSEFIVSESNKYGYDPFLLTALIITESSFNNWAQSHRGALGLMQIQPRTAVALAKETQREWKGKPTLYDPGVNIALGAYYLDKLIKRFGDLRLALEAYNHGPTKLSRYLRNGRKPTDYSRRVISQYEMIRPQPI